MNTAALSLHRCLVALSGLVSGMAAALLIY